MSKSITTVWFIVLLGLMGVDSAVKAQNPTSGTAGPLTWKYDTGTKTLTVSGKGDMPDYDVLGEVPWKKHVESILTLVVEEGVTGIGNSAFNGARNMRAAILPGTVARIGERAFSDCVGLVHVTFPAGAGLKTIGRNGFFGCSISSITLPEGLEEIGESAFSHCELTTLRIPAGLKSMGQDAFGDNNYLTAVTVDESNSVFSSVDGVLFDKSRTILIRYPIRHPKVAYVIPQGVRRIGDQAFCGCEHLLSVTFPPGLESMGNYAFGLCDKLTSVTFPSGLKEIGMDAFNQCDALTAVIIPEGVRFVRAGAFRSCKKLTSVTLPASLEYLGSGAFSDCENLKHVTVKTKTPPDEYADVFRRVPLANVTLTVPKGSKAAYAAADEWKNFKQIAEATGIIALPDARIYAADGRLYLSLPTSVEVQVYSLGGRLVRAFRAPAGQTTVALPAGIYIVRAGERSEKVYVI